MTLFSHYFTQKLTGFPRPQMFCSAPTALQHRSPRLFSRRAHRRVRPAFPNAEIQPADLTRHHTPRAMRCFQPAS